MGEEASDPRPELSGLHPFLVPGNKWIQRESEDSRGPKSGCGGRKWLDYCGPSLHWETGPGLHLSWET